MAGRGWSIASDFRPVIRSTISSKRFESVSRLYIYIYRSNLAYTYFIAARTIRFANHRSLLTSCKKMIIVILFVNRSGRIVDGGKEGKIERERKRKKIIRSIEVGKEGARGIENDVPLDSWTPFLIVSHVPTYETTCYRAAITRLMHVSSSSFAGASTPKQTKRTVT